MGGAETARLHRQPEGNAIGDMRRAEDGESYREQRGVTGEGAHQAASGQSASPPQVA